MIQEKGERFIHSNIIQGGYILIRRFKSLLITLQIFWICAMIIWIHTKASKGNIEGKGIWKFKINLKVQGYKWITSSNFQVTIHQSFHLFKFQNTLQISNTIYNIQKHTTKMRNTLKDAILILIIAFCVALSCLKCNLSLLPSSLPSSWPNRRIVTCHDLCLLFQSKAILNIYTTKRKLRRRTLQKIP